MRTPNKFVFIFSAICISLFFACTGYDSNQSEVTEEVTEEVAEQGLEAETITEKIPVLLINHRVEDFNVWKKGFDKHKPIRQSFNVKVLYIFRLVDDTNNITVLLQLNDIEDARRYVTSQGLKETMEKHGVINKPKVRFFNIFQPIPGYKPGTCLLISHRVRNYEEWKDGFDEQEPARWLYGLRALSIFSSIDDDNNVMILFEVNDLMSAQYYASSQKLKDAMIEFGVIGELEVNFVNTVQ